MKLEPTVINPFFIVCVTNISQKTSDQKSVESRTLERGAGAVIFCNGLYGEAPPKGVRFLGFRYMKGLGFH